MCTQHTHTHAFPHRHVWEAKAMAMALMNYRSFNTLIRSHYSMIRVPDACA